MHPTGPPGGVGDLLLAQHRHALCLPLGRAGFADPALRAGYARPSEAVPAQRDGGPARPTDGDVRAKALPASALKTEATRRAVGQGSLRDPALAERPVDVRSFASSRILVHKELPTAGTGARGARQLRPARGDLLREIQRETRDVERRAAVARDVGALALVRRCAAGEVTARGVVDQARRESRAHLVTTVRRFAVACDEGGRDESDGDERAKGHRGCRTIVAKAVPRNRARQGYCPPNVVSTAMPFFSV